MHLRTVTPLSLPVLYNFEFITPKVRNVTVRMEDDMSVPNSWITPMFLEIHRAYRVWDYSWSNLLAFQKHGVAARLVPVGYADVMAKAPPLPEAQRDIDVLFFGACAPPLPASGRLVSVSLSLG